MSNLNIAQPISPKDIKDFSKWVMYGGFRRYHNDGRIDDSHLGHDFISYLNTRGKEHFRLSPATPVRAIADGKVKLIHKKPVSYPFSDYELYIAVQHPEHGMTSGYMHVVPCVNIEDTVRKGQIIATLFDTSAYMPDISLATHLHFELGHSLRINLTYPFLNEQIDPLHEIPKLSDISVRPVSPFSPRVRK